MEIKKLIGIRIKTLRKKKGLSQEELAEKAHITSKHVSSIELGKENPTFETFLSLSVALDVEIWELLNVEGDDLSKKELESQISRQMRAADEKTLRLFLKIIQSLNQLS